jgi:chromosome segregation ATPase
MGYEDLLDDLEMTKIEALTFVLSVLNTELADNQAQLRTARLELLRYRVTRRDAVAEIKDLKRQILKLKIEQDALMEEIAKVKPELESLGE